MKFASYATAAAFLLTTCTVGFAQDAQRAEERAAQDAERASDSADRAAERAVDRAQRAEQRAERAERAEDRAEDRAERAAERRAERERSDVRIRQDEDRVREDEVELAADTVVERRQEVIDMAKDTIADLTDSDPAAKDLYDAAYGYAVFDTTKAGFLVTGAGGTGAAMRTGRGGEPVIMHMGAGGVGLGGGVENYKLVILFEDEDTFDRFLDGGWTAGASAQAAAGRDGAAVVGRFVNGVAVYHLTDGGAIAQADVTGVRFWRSDRLNPGIG